MQALFVWKQKAGGVSTSLAELLKRSRRDCLYLLYGRRKNQKGLNAFAEKPAGWQSGKDERSVGIRSLPSPNDQEMKKVLLIYVASVDCQPPKSLGPIQAVCGFA
jgi:hypothetical protein